MNCHPERVGRRGDRGVEGSLSDLVLFSVGLLSGYVGRWPRFATVQGITQEQAPKETKEITTGLINSFARVSGSLRLGPEAPYRLLASRIYSDMLQWEAAHGPDLWTDAYKPRSSRRKTVAPLLSASFWCGGVRTGQRTGPREDRSEEHT